MVMKKKCHKLLVCPPASKINNLFFVFLLFPMDFTYQIAHNLYLNSKLEYQKHDIFFTDRLFPVNINFKYKFPVHAGKSK